MTSVSSRHSPTKRRRPGRAAVVWFVLGFVLIQGAIGYAVDVHLPEVRDPEFAIREVALQKVRAAAPDRPLTVVFGTSHVMYGFSAGRSTELMGERTLVFNYGLPGGGPLAQQVCLSRLCEAGLQPDYAVFEIVPAFFNANNARESHLFDGARLQCGELARLCAYPDAWEGFLPKWLKARLLPCDRHQAELRDWIGLDVSRGQVAPVLERMIDPHGWQPHPNNPDCYPFLTKVAHTMYDKCYRDFRYSEAQERVILDLVASAQSRGIRVAVVLMPAGSEFRSAYAQELQTRIDSLLVNLQRNGGVKVLDAREWIDDDGFYDMHHLTPEAAMRFTERFTNELLVPFCK